MHSFPHSSPPPIICGPVDSYNGHLLALEAVLTQTIRAAYGKENKLIKGHSGIPFCIPVEVGLRTVPVLKLWQAWSSSKIHGHC